MSKQQRLEGDLPALLGPPRSSRRHESSSLKAWFLCLRPGARPHIGRSTGRATSTSWVISAKRITNCNTQYGGLFRNSLLGRDSSVGGVVAP